MKAFIIGKGGVGKSTISVGLALAIKDKNPLLVSLDPAHNISDILSGANKINIEVKEPDFEKELSSYLKNLTETMKKEAFRYLTVFNMENLLDTLRYSPGTEEHMLLEVIKKNIDHENVIFDTPPTGLFMKVLGLLRSNIMWLQKLIELRKEIINRKGIKKDAILDILKTKFSEYTELEQKIQNDAVFIGVSTPEPLSLRETERIIGFLKTEGYALPFIIVNRTKISGPIFKNLKHVFIPSYIGTPFEIAEKASIIIKKNLKEWVTF